MFSLCVRTSLLSSIIREDLFFRREQWMIDKLVRESVEKLEIFRPLKGGFQPKSHLETFVSKFPRYISRHWASEKTTHEKKMEELLKLAKQSEGLMPNELIGPRSEESKSIVRGINSGRYVSKGSTSLVIFIINVHQDLQREDLTLYERLWNLSVLQILQSCQATGKMKLPPIKDDPRTGPVSRGGLELFLTKGLDCRPKEVSNGNIDGDDRALVNESVVEALQRVELIVNIKNHLRVSEDLSPTLIQVHNKLLQTRSFSKRAIDELSLQCIQHMNDNHTSTQEAVCLYHIFQHLLKFHPNAKKICESNLEASERFKAIEKIIKRQTILQHFIEEQINEADVDPFMANFYLSLKRWDVCLDSIKRHLNLLHIQNSALEQGKAELYNVNKIKPEMYIINQDIFIGLLYKAIPYFEGLGDYLHSQVILNRHGHYEYISKISLEDMEESDHACPICLVGFLKGQRVINLRCHHSHIFHQDCISKGVPLYRLVEVWFHCPICRRRIELPFTHEEHISFDQ